MQVDHSRTACRAESTADSRCGICRHHRSRDIAGAAAAFPKNLSETEFQSFFSLSLPFPSPPPWQGVAAHDLIEHEDQYLKKGEARAGMPPGSWHGLRACTCDTACLHPAATAPRPSPHAAHHPAPLQFPTPHRAGEQPEGAPRGTHARAGASRPVGDGAGAGRGAAPRPHGAAGPPWRPLLRPACRARTQVGRRWRTGGTLDPALAAAAVAGPQTCSPSAVPHRPAAGCHSVGSPRMPRSPCWWSPRHSPLAHRQRRAGRGRWPESATLAATVAALFPSAPALAMIHPMRLATHTRYPVTDLR